MKFDDILVRIGEFGWYQKKVYFILMLPALLCGCQVMSVVFTMAIPPYRCAIPGYDNDTYHIQSPLHADLVNVIIPNAKGRHDSEGPYEECKYYSDVNASTFFEVHYDGLSNFSSFWDHLGNGNSSGAARPQRECHRWVYDRTEFRETVMTEFNIVCGDKIMRSHSNTVQFAGALFGSVFMGLVADIMGRKKAIMLSLVIQCATSLGIFLAPDFNTIIPIRAFAGIASHSLFAISATTGIELVGPSKRTFTGIVVEFYWTAGEFLVLPVAYLLQDWRYIQLFLCLAALPLFSLWCLVPESPRWLLDKKRFTETEEILEKICKSNNTKLPLGAVDASTADDGPQAKLWELFSHRILIVRTLIVFINWLAVNLLYYGLSLNVGNLAGSTYLNFFLGVLVEVLGYLLVLLLLDRTGRRRLHCACMFVGGLACLAVMIPVGLGGPEHQWITTALAMVGKLCSSACYGALYIMSAELFPTVFRNSAIGCCSIFENIGGMISTYIADLGVLVGGPMAQGLPMIVFGAVSITAGSLSLILPETLNRKLPETIQDAIDFDKGDVITTSNVNSDYMISDNVEQDLLTSSKA